MKNILLVDCSPRKGGNSEVIVDTIADDLKNCNVTVFKMREKDCHPCLACAACQGKNTQMCVQRDDLTANLPAIDKADAIVITTPVYNQQMSAQAKMFIDRTYPFFNNEKEGRTNTTNKGKKAAFVCSCWAGPKDVYEKYAADTVKALWQIGATDFKSYVFEMIPNRGDILKNPAHMEKVHELAKWLAE
jgi:multimeric flavodoxin WrbA